MGNSNIMIPDHIAFIMDGNGRWATKRGLPRTAGHSAGANVMETIMKHCHSIHLKYATFYAFSTENWSRPEEEVNAIMKLLADYLDRLKNDINSGRVEMFRDTKMRFVGDIDGVSDVLREKIDTIEKLTDGDDKSLVINIAFNYGGRPEVVNSVNAFIREHPGQEITEKDISDRLYTYPCPDPDLIIRTAGEMRLSNFLLWQSAYAEFYSTKLTWPEFTPRELDRAIEAYTSRTRKFGGVK